jgi:hypothetical protein
MIERPSIGPRLSDHDFFNRVLDTSQPELSPIREAAIEEAYATARSLFAAYVRRTVQPDRFFTIERQFRGSNFMYPGESLEEAAEI